MRRHAALPGSPHRGPRAGARHCTRGNGRLLRRTFLIAFLLVSGGLLSSSAVELVFRYHESVESMRAVQHEMAHTVAVQVHQFVAEITQLLRAATHTPDIVASGLTEAYRFHLRKLLHVAPAITTAVAVDTTGHERCKVSRVAMVLPDDLGNRSGERAVVQALAGQAFFGAVYFVRQSEPYMHMAVPIERFPGEVIGALIAEVNLTYIWEVIARITVGQTGYAYVVSQDGDLIAHPDISLVLQNSNLRSLSQVQAALRGTLGPLTHTNLRGKQVFPTAMAIPTLGWVVLVERLAEEAYAPLYTSLLRTATLFLLGLGMAGLANVLMGRRVVRPIEILRQGAARIGAGALHHRIDVRTGDELQALAEEFNAMTTRLQISYADLEHQVAARTGELARSVAELRALNEVSRAVSSTLDVHTVLTTVVTHAVQLAGAQGGALYVYEAGSATLALRATSGSDTPFFDALHAAPTVFGTETVGQAIAARAPVHVPDLLAGSPAALSQGHGMLARAGYRALLTVPLLLDEGILGGLVVWRQAVGAFPDDLMHLLQTCAAQSSLAIQHAQLFRELEARGRALERANQRLELANQHLETANQHKSQFLATMSHELRTPLHAILGYTQLILDRIYGEIPPVIAEKLQRVHQSGQHLLTLINAVLDLARIESGRLVLSLTEYVMPEIVSTVVTTVEHLAAAKQLRLTVTMPTDLPRGTGDAHRLTQVLFNLVGNAIAYTEVGEVRIEVAASADTFTLVVRDTGPGIAPEDQQRIFEAFQQGELARTRTQTGTGLGLAIAKQIIELHGGHIGVRSRPGQGATFWCTVPVRVAPAGEGP